MRRALRLAFVGAAALVLAIGALWVAFPGATASAAGTPDPLLGVRRPVVTWLRKAGLLAKPRRFVGDRFLPTVANSMVVEDQMTSIRQDPVYRGLLWRVGTRITAEHDAPPTARSVRLAYRVGDRHVVAAVGERAKAAASGPWVRWRVTGYVPDGWTSWGLEEVAEDGTVSGVTGEEIEPAP